MPGVLRRDGGDDLGERGYEVFVGGGDGEEGLGGAEGRVEDEAVRGIHCGG